MKSWPCGEAFIKPWPHCSKRQPICEFADLDKYHYYLRAACVLRERGDFWLHTATDAATHLFAIETGVGTICQLGREMA